MSNTNTMPRVWRGLALLARIDMAVCVAIAAALLIWMAWH